MRIGSLFSGIGGLELGLELALGGHVVWQVEQDDHARQVLARHWPDADRSVTDVCEAGAHNLAPVDLICGGFPCQDISNAGLQAGLDGAKSGLFFELARVIREVRPRYIVLENVAAITARGLERVLGEVAELGYDAEWGVLSAGALGAPHVRRRWYLIGWLPDADGIQLREQPDREPRRGGPPVAANDGGEGCVADAEGDRLEGDRLEGGRMAAGQQREDVAHADGCSRGGADVPHATRIGQRAGRARGTAAQGQDGAASGLLAHPVRLGLEAHGQPSGLQPQEPESWADGGREVEPRVGGAADGLPAGLDGWQRGPGPIEPWERDTPRTVPERGPHWKGRLRCLGNAVVPQWSYEVGCRLREVAP